jgi:intein/homing endonuclease
MIIFEYIKFKGKIMEGLEKEHLICELYQNGVKNADICKQCHCSTNTISKVIDKYNIPRRAKPKKVKKDLSKFKDLDSFETQYWLGYICADGSVEFNTSSRVYKVSLYSKDYEVIEKFQKYFGDIICIHKSKSQLYEAYISSKELCEYFINDLNITPNKTLSLNPNIEYTNNFILGYFDGDGCIVNSTNNRTRYESNFTSGSLIFLEKIKEQLDSIGIYSIIYKHPDCNTYKVRIDRKEDSEKLYKWMYKDNIPCLSRKLNNYVALFGNLEMNKLGELRGNIGKSAAKQEEQNFLEGSTTNN